MSMNRPTSPTSSLSDTDTRTMDPAAPIKYAALTVALVFTLIGVVGFAITGLDNFADHDAGHKLLWFEINPLHNIVHLAFGLAGLAMWNTLRGVMRFGLLVGVGYTGALLYGLIAVDETWDFLSINSADNWLHLFLAIVGFSLAAAARARLADETPAAATRDLHSDARLR